MSVRKLIFIGLQAGWKNKKKKTLKFQLQSFLLLLLVFSFLFIWWSRSPLCASWRHKNFLHSRTPEMPKQYTLRNKTQKTENMIRKKSRKKNQNITDIKMCRYRNSTASSFVLLLEIGISNWKFPHRYLQLNVSRWARRGDGAWKRKGDAEMAMRRMRNFHKTFNGWKTTFAKCWEKCLRFCLLLIDLSVQQSG